MEKTLAELINISFTPDERDEFEERAAIIEYDGNFNGRYFNRDMAEFMAYVLTKAKRDKTGLYAEPKPDIPDKSVSLPTPSKS